VESVAELYELAVGFTESVAAAPETVVVVGVIVRLMLDSKMAVIE
jgi:hypothetical protein